MTPHVAINGHGNVAHSFYDGLGRPIRSEVLLKQGGVGDGQLNLNGVYTNLDTSNPSNADGKITVSQSFDKSSRLLSRTDDNGNVSAYAYDARDRAVYSVGADLTVSRTIYDADSLVRQTIDRNGTVVDRSYDAIGRLLKVQATLRASNLENTGQAVEGSTTQAFEYDGLSRLRLAVDQNDPLTGGDDVATSFTYDSLGRQLTERHRFRVSSTINNVSTTNGRISVGATTLDRTIARTFDQDSNRTSTTYSSGRVLDYQLDGADRLQAIRDSLGTITATEFLGGRPIASTTGRGTVSTSYSYDLKRRLTSLDHVSGASRVAGFAYTWDRADRRSSETHLGAAGVSARTETYTYDSASRITQVAFGDARPATSYLIDGVGNWASRTEGGQTQTTNQRQNGTYAPDLMNEVSRLATFSLAGALVKDEAQTQDANGNRIRSGEFKLSFDVFDRLVRVERTSDGATVGRYRYDALGRRVDRMFVARGDVAGAQQQVFHVSDGAQEVEELDAAGNVVADYVWGGLYLDQCVQVRRNGQEFYLHTNSIFSVVAATNASGAVVERYAYSSIYGVASVKDAAGADRGSSEEIGNPWRFQGRRFDQETGFYYFRVRYLDPGQGRFVNRDPIGVWGDAGNLGNGYSFCGNDPVNFVDPFGLSPFSDLISGLLGLNDDGYEPTPKPGAPGEWWDTPGGLEVGPILSPAPGDGTTPAPLAFGEGGGKPIGAMVAATVTVYAALKVPLIGAVLFILNSGATNQSSENSDVPVTILKGLLIRGPGPCPGGASTTQNAFSQGPGKIVGGGTPVSLQRARQLAGKAGVPVSRYSIRMDPQKPVVSGQLGRTPFRPVSGSSPSGQEITKYAPGEVDRLGRPVIYLQRAALQSPQHAVHTIAHEIDHVRRAAQGQQIRGMDAERLADQAGAAAVERLTRVFKGR